MTKKAQNAPAPWRTGAGLGAGLGLLALLGASLAVGAQGPSAAPFTWLVAPWGEFISAVPPLPPTAVYPVQLVLDDDGPEASFGVTTQTGAARQFLWFNQFSPGVHFLAGAPFQLEQLWVLFPAGSNMAVGSPIQLAVYEDADGDPTTGAVLVGEVDETIQAVDGNTFSVYTLATPIELSGQVDVLIGVVPRFIVSGVTSATSPAALDTTASAGRSWLGTWTADPPDPPDMTMPGTDPAVQNMDDLFAGNWMVRGFGTFVGGFQADIPILGGPGLTLLALALALSAAAVLRRRTRAAAVLLLALAALGLAAPAAAQTTIDSFTTSQAGIADPPGGSSTATGGADIIGTRRGLVIDLLAGAGPVSVGVTGGALSLVVPDTTPNSRGEARLQWDGDLTPTVLTPGGLGGVNLTAGGASGFRIRVNSSTAASGEIEMRVHSSATASSRASLLLPVVGAPQNFFLPFSEFIQTGTSAANFASVGAIEMTVRGQEGTLALDEVVTAVPVIAATKVDALIVDDDSDTRADPGDRLRYTVTITNTGSAALGVDLTDMVDPNTTLDADTVSATPVAINDQYAGTGNVFLTVDGSAGRPLLLANDTDPDGDTVTISTFDATTAQGGTISAVDVDTGAFTYTPPAGFRGVDSFNYTIVDDDALASTAMARITLQGIVWFVDDSNTTPPHLGTLADPFPALSHVSAAGDPDEPGDTIFLFDDDGTPYPGGLVLEANQHLIGEAQGLTLGSDVIVPAGGRPQMTHAAGTGLMLAADNTVRGFDVQGTSGTGIAGTSFGTLTATDVNVTSTAGTVLDLATGNLAATFGTLSSTGTGGQRGIQLVGVTGSLTVTTTSLTNPTTQGIRVTTSPGAVLDFGNTTITDNAIGSGATATGIDVATGNAGAAFTFDSLAVTTDAGSGLVASGSGTIDIAGTGNSIVATGGPAVDITSTSLGSGATFTTLSSTNSTGKGVNLDTVTGALTANGGSISGPSGIAFDLNAGASNVTYAGSVSNTANARLIEVTGRTGGTVTFSGNLSGTSNSDGINVANNNASGTPAINFSGSTKTLNTGTSPAVTLDNNDVATINFTGGGLDIDTTSGIGFNAINGAVGITVQGIGNSITSTTGSALNVVSSTIGASGLTFQAIASNGAVSGIVLNATGGSGGLTVTGSGGTCTVATPTCTGGSILSSTGPGINLTSTFDVDLALMRINGGGDDGIRGTTVNGFVIANSVVSSNGNAAGENGMDFGGLTGSCSMTSTVVTGSAENNVVVRNNTGVLTAFTVTGSTFSSNSAIGADGLLFDATGTADITASVTGSTFTSNRDDHFQAAAANTSQLDITFTGNTLTGGHATALSQGVTINAATAVPGYAGSVAYNISNNSINGAILNAIEVNLGTSSVAATMNGTIANNMIGTTGSFQSGSTTGSGIGVDAHGNGTHTVSVTGNTIRQTFDRGINVLANDGSGTLNMTVTGNNSSHSDGTNSREGFFINAGSADPNIFGVADAHFVCLTLGGAGALRNTLTHGPGAPDDFRLRQRFNTTIRLPGYGGGAADTGAVVTFVNGNNISTTGSATVNTPPGGGFVGGAACPLP